MKIFKKILLFSIVLYSGTVSANPYIKATKAINLADIKKIIIDLSADKYQGRLAGSESSKKAAQYLDSLLIQSGYAPVRDNFFCPELGRNLSNITVQLKGKDTNSFVVIGAHYDGLGVKKGEIYHGADDNMSGVAAVMTIAKMYKRCGKKPEKTIIFAFWDGEEEDFLGSIHYMSNFYKPERVALYMNFDMVGRANNGDIFPEVSYAWNNNFPYLKTLCSESLNKALPDKNRSLDITYEMRWGDGKGGSDYVAFSKYNIPYIAWMEVEMHPDYHKPTDTSDKISWVKLERVINFSFYITALMSGIII